MQYLELLAPARTKDIGIAAVNCGADAVYIAGPDFGARKAAGNSFDDIQELCSYAHKFGVRVFVTYNTVVRREELPLVHHQMLLSQEAGADSFIIRDPSLCAWEDIHIPLHASTQCAIRSVERARQYVEAGCSRIVLERELSLEEIRKISAAIRCEVEVFVHGALCVCYSGECRLSEHIDGRSADRGECIQACRSLYDLTDENGHVLLRNKALLSLKDYNLINRIGELAEAGVCSFKIEGRLKNASYVKNTVRAYDIALNDFISKYPRQYARASFGRVDRGFEPDLNKTFNRGYTELFLDGERRKAWSSMDAPKSMGEKVGIVESIRRNTLDMELRLKPQSKGVELRNGDGFAFTTKAGVVGFRGDVCEGVRIKSKNIPEIGVGTVLFRNINASFEKILENSPIRREIQVGLRLRISGKFKIEVFSLTEDGREQTSVFNADIEPARDKQREQILLCEQLSKRSSVYRFFLKEIQTDTCNGELPLLSVSTINSIRRAVASDLDAVLCKRLPLYDCNVSEISTPRLAIKDIPLDSYYCRSEKSPLMRSRYCVRFELGMCPVMQGATPPKRLYIVNNGRKLALNFDCKACEMTITEEQN